MSMRHYTVKMLKDLIKDLPDDMYVVTRTFEENWTSEGMFDGIRPYITEKLWEIRTGFIPSDDQPCSYGEVLILSDFDDEDNLERWNNHVEELKLDELKVNGLVSGDIVLVAPAVDTAQFATNATYSGAAVTSIVVTTAIPSDTPASGTIRVECNSGIYKRVPFTSWTGSTFTITSTNFSTDNSTAGNDLYISYIDKEIASTSESFTAFVTSKNCSTYKLKI